MQTTNTILPSQTIGIIGGGQLGRMMAIAARYMGYKIVVLDPTPDCPTAHVADQQIVAAYDDLTAIDELMDCCDVITYEFENVDLQAAAIIHQSGKLPQGTRALEVTQNREKEKRVVSDLALPVPDYYIVTSTQECEHALDSISFPAVIKTCRGGYDGKGQLKIHNESEKALAIQFFKQHGYCIVEQWITFDKEVSVVFTRSKNGDIQFFPLAENVHRDHILYITTVPANIDQHIYESACQIAEKIADHMDIVGTFAIEMFVKGKEVYVNEMAPRPHNSGHYTIEGCNVSQFAQHIRAICGLPLIEVELHGPTAMINVLGNDIEYAKTFLTKSNVGFLHLYGKEEPKQKRKMGHITFTAKTVEELEKQVNYFKEEIHS